MLRQARQKSETTLRSRELRANATYAEKLLWQELRRKAFYGLRFRRQFPLGPYFADFVCLPARLIIELDGAQHADEAHASHDEKRTQWLVSQNFRVLRFWNGEVLNDLGRVLDRIDSELRRAPADVSGA